MMRTIGSQNRETLADSGIRLVSVDSEARTVILQDIETGEKELWVENDHHAGYTIEINSVGYEFVTSNPNQ